MKLTQQEIAIKAGVGIRFIRELEQGKETLQLDKVNLVLALFGFSLSPVRQHINAYDIDRDYYSKAVKITLTNKEIKYGFIIGKIYDPVENTITAWKFVSNNNAINYKRKSSDKLTETILHSTIQNIEAQK
jgi:transcriptional regulator with XRE-family HTH domain